jgi:hypothetical protein
MKYKNIIMIISLIILSIRCNNESNVTEQKSQNDNLKINHSENQNNILFDELFNSIKGMNQFEGTAFVGALDGQFFMVLLKNNDGDNMIKVRYQIINYILGKADLVDETYTVHNLERISGRKVDYGLNDKRFLTDAYLKGNVKGYKSSINNGKVTNISSEGIIKFVLDSVNYKLQSVVIGSSNWSFQGDLQLDKNTYLKLRNLFYNHLNKNQVDSNIQTTELSKSKLNDLPEAYIGHWVTDYSNCDLDGGIFIEKINNKLNVSGWEWSSSEVSVSYLNGFYVLDIFGYNEGSEFNSKLKIITNEEGSMILDDDTYRFCCGEPTNSNRLIKCR